MIPSSFTFSQLEEIQELISEAVKAERNFLIHVVDQIYYGTIDSSEAEHTCLKIMRMLKEQK